MSLTYDVSETTNGLKYSSTNLLALSLIEPMPEIIGLPGGSVRLLCIFGSI